MKSENDELQDILHDPDIGIDVPDRKLKLARAQKITKTINYTAIVISVLMLVCRIWDWLPSLTELFIVATLAFPIVPFIAISRYKYLINFIEISKKDIRPSLGIAFGFSGFACLIKAIAYHMLYYSLCIGSTFIGFGLITFIFYQILPKTGKGRSKYDCLTAAFFMLPYCYAAPIIINCHYDNAKPFYYHTTVLGKYEAHGKSTSYYLQLQKWGPIPDDEDVSVSNNLYSRIKQDQTVTIALNPGVFHMPWYYIDN